MEEKSVIFKPITGKSLLMAYPELNKYPPFQPANLTNKELEFVWYYSCQSSELVKKNINDLSRSELAYNHVFGKNDKDTSRRAKYLSLQFPEKVREAMDVMKKFSPEIRSRGKKLYEKILENYEAMIDIDPDDPEQFKNKDGEQDWSKKKAYIDSCRIVTNALDELVEKIEGGLGVSKKSGDEDDDDELGEGTIDTYVQTKKG